MIKWLYFHDKNSFYTWLAQTLGIPLERVAEGEARAEARPEAWAKPRALSPAQVERIVEALRPAYAPGTVITL